MGFYWMLKIAVTLSSMLRFSAEKFVYPDRPDIKLPKLPLITHTLQSFLRATYIEF